MAVLDEIEQRDLLGNVTTVGTALKAALTQRKGASDSIGDVRGHWAYVDGEAHVTWDDGAQDAIRRVDSRFQKFAYSSGKQFTDEPDNVTGARNTMPKPI